MNGTQWTTDSNMSKVSVIMPIGPGHERIARGAIQSIRNQTFEDWELLISVDKKVDTSQLTETHRVKILDGFAQTPTEGYNMGLDAANGEYIAIMDADDRATENRLEWSVNFLESRSEIDLLGQSDPTVRRKKGENVVVKEYDPESYVPFNDLRHGNPLVHSTVMYRSSEKRYRSKFHYSQDFDLYLRIANSDYSNIASVSNDLGTRMELEDSQTNSNQPRSSNYGMVAALMRLRREQGLPELYEEWDTDMWVIGDVLAEEYNLKN